jgi:N-acetyl-alpha-D-muramate 1-phosphate uridylyltransferase
MFPVIILAGGLATRMRPVTEKIPKAMINVNGKPFIHHQITLLKKKGIINIIICVGYLGEQIEEYIGDGSKFGINVDYSYDGDVLLGTGGAIAKIKDRLPDTFFVLYGDSYLDINYQKVESAYQISGKKGLMTVFKNDNQWDTSNVVFKQNKLIKYSKINKTEDMNYIDYGLGILKKSVFMVFPHGTVFDLAAIYEKLSDENQLEGYEVFERFYENGSSQGLSDLCKVL